MKLGTRTKVMLEFLQCCNPFFIAHRVKPNFINFFQVSQLNSMPLNDIGILEEEGGSAFNLQSTFMTLD